MPLPAAMDARARSESTPGVCAQPCTQRRALSAPLLLRLYTHMRRTSERPWGSSERSMSVQLPFALWFLISARSAADQPSASSASACLRVRGSADTDEAASAQPWPRTPSDTASCGRCRRVTSMADERRGYDPRPRWKGARPAGSESSCVDDVALVDSRALSAVAGGVGWGAAVALSMGCATATGIGTVFVEGCA
eukprot:6212241-Pleurochrysis_carterae.AAC.1